MSDNNKIPTKSDASSMLEELQSVLKKYDMFEEESYLIVRTNNLRFHKAKKKCKPPCQQILDYVQEGNELVLKLVCKCPE